YGQRVSSNGELIGRPFPISVAPNDQLHPSISYNPTDNQYLVVWEDARNTATSPWDIYGQRVAANGELIGSNFPVSVAPEIQRAPAVTYNAGDNQYLVVWEDLRDRLRSGSDIYGQIVSNAGELLGDNFPISTAPGGQVRPSVAFANLDHQYLVVWEDSR